MLLALAGCRDQPAPVRAPNASRVVLHDSASSDTATTPGEILRRYYDSIQARNYDSAYSLWGQGGQASGQTRAAFAAGFTQTEQVRATVGDSVSLEGAAGSQYATVPVRIDAVTRTGQQQHFVGAYTLRRTLVDGATPEQRRWHIYSADLRPL